MISENNQDNRTVGVKKTGFQLHNEGFQELLTKKKDQNILPKVGISCHIMTIHLKSTKLSKELHGTDLLQVLAV